MSLTVDKCLQAWTNSLKQMNAKADIVFFGDSLTYYGDFASVFPGKVVCNLGLRGDTIQGMIDRVEQIGLLEPKIVFVMVGINDVAYLMPNQFGSKFESLLDMIQHHALEANLIIQSLLPVNNAKYSISCTNELIIRFNDEIKQRAIKHHLPYLDLYSLYLSEQGLSTDETIDGIHLNQRAYNKWYKLLSTIDE